MLVCDVFISQNLKMVSNPFKRQPCCVPSATCVSSLTSVYYNLYLTVFMGQEWRIGYERVNESRCMCAHILRNLLLALNNSC